MSRRKSENVENIQSKNQNTEKNKSHKHNESALQLHYTEQLQTVFGPVTVRRLIGTVKNGIA